MTEHTLWCRSTFEKLNDDGVWAVPRTGMLFRKNKTARTLVWVASFPHEENFGVPPETARISDFMNIRHEFAKAGIPVELGFPIEEYASVDEAIADQKKKLMVRAS